MRPARTGRYIVTVADASPDRAEVNGVGGDLAKRYHGRVDRVWGNGLGSFSIAMSEADAGRLAGGPRAAYVEQDQRWSVAASQDSPPNWGLDRIDQRRPTDTSNVRYDYADSAGLGACV